MGRVTDIDWHQDDDGVWFLLDDYTVLAFTEDEIADWPPLVALRNDNARLAIDADHLRALLAKIINGCGYLSQTAPDAAGGRHMRYDGDCELTDAEVATIDRIVKGDDR